MGDAKGVYCNGDYMLSSQKETARFFRRRQSGADYGYARGRGKVGKAARLQQFNNDGTFRLEETVSN